MAFWKVINVKLFDLFSIWYYFIEENVERIGVCNSEQGWEADKHGGEAEKQLAFEAQGEDLDQWGGYPTSRPVSTVPQKVVRNSPTHDR